MRPIIFNIPERISTNDIYSGVHWTKRNDHKKLYRGVPFIASPVTNYPVECHYHFKFTGRTMDITNFSYMVKLIEDALVKKSVLKDDSQKYVSKVSISAEKADSDICEITIKSLIS